MEEDRMLTDTELAEFSNQISEIKQMVDGYLTESNRTMESQNRRHEELMAQMQGQNESQIRRHEERMAQIRSMFESQNRMIGGHSPTSRPVSDHSQPTAISGSDCSFGTRSASAMQGSPWCWSSTPSGYLNMLESGFVCATASPLLGTSVLDLAIDAIPFLVPKPVQQVSDPGSLETKYDIVMSLSETRIDGPRLLELTKKSEEEEMESPYLPVSIEKVTVHTVNGDDTHQEVEEKVIEEDVETLAEYKCVTHLASSAQVLATKASVTGNQLNIPLLIIWSDYEYMDPYLNPPTDGLKILEIICTPTVCKNASADLTSQFAASLKLCCTSYNSVGFHGVDSKHIKLDKPPPLPLELEYGDGFDIVWWKTFVSSDLVGLAYISNCYSKKCSVTCVDEYAKVWLLPSHGLNSTLRLCMLGVHKYDFLKLIWLQKPPPWPPDVYMNNATSQAIERAMIFEQMGVGKGIAKLIAGLSWIQDYEIGDGTTETDWNDINLESIKIVRFGDQQNDGLLNVSLKMENCKCQGKHIPHVHGFGTLAWSWNAAKALPMKRESTVFWKFSLNVTPNHETLDFESLLKLQHSHAMPMIKEGPKPKVSLTQKILQGDSKVFVFKLSSEDNDGNEEFFEYRVVMKADKVWLLFIAASWRAYQDNLLPWTVYGILIVIIIVLLENVDNRPSVSLKPNIEQCVALVPPASANSGLVYAVKLSKKSSIFIQHGEEFFNIDSPVDAPYLYKDSRTCTTMQPENEQRRLFAEKGLRFPGMVKSSNARSFDDNHSLDSEAKGMPAAAGAVAVEDSNYTPSTYSLSLLSNGIKGFIVSTMFFSRLENKLAADDMIKLGVEALQGIDAQSLSGWYLIGARFFLGSSFTLGLHTPTPFSYAEILLELLNMNSLQFWCGEGGARKINFDGCFGMNGEVDSKGKLWTKQ